MQNNFFRSIMPPIMNRPVEISAFTQAATTEMINSSQSRSG